MPNQHLVGLRAIVLTLGATRSTQWKHAIATGRPAATTTALGCYHPKQAEGDAWIELFIDNIMKQYPSWILRFRTAVEFALSLVLLHELGHHISYTMSERGNPEHLAERWSDKLVGRYLQQRYPRVIRLVLALGRSRMARAIRHRIKGAPPRSSSCLHSRR